MSVGTRAHFLLDIHHADVRREPAHLATGDVSLCQIRTSAVPKKRRFADSVATDQTVLVAVHQFQPRADDQLLARDADGDVLHGNVHRLALRLHVHGELGRLRLVHLLGGSGGLGVRRTGKKHHLATLGTTFHTLLSRLQHLHVLLLVNVVICVDKQLG